MFSAKEFYETFATVENGTITFEMSVAFSDLASDAVCSGIFILNELVDQLVENGVYLSDIAYKPLRIENDAIIIQVVCNGADWLEEFEFDPKLTFEAGK